MLSSIASGYLSKATGTVKGMLGQEEAEKGLLSTLDDAVTLSWKQRFIGFACCFGLGLLLTLVSIPMLWTVQLTKFAIFYSFGSIVSLCSTMFLMGPVNQVKKMMEANRFIATSVYLLSIVATLFVAIKLHNAPLALMCLVIQMAALVWYCFTWIPGGVPFLKATIMGAVG